MMREGTHTILSMQTNYDGPLEPFALVVPLPAEIRPVDARTLPRALFERVALLGAPRLVQCWEEAPCAGQTRTDAGAGGPTSHGPGAKSAAQPTGATRGAPRAVQTVPPEYD